MGSLVPLPRSPSPPRCSYEDEVHVPLIRSIARCCCSRCGRRRRGRVRPILLPCNLSRHGDDAPCITFVEDRSQERNTNNPRLQGRVESAEGRVGVERATLLLVDIRPSVHETP